MPILRKANINDIRQYFDWKNDKVVRQNAFNTKVVNWREHQKWFKNKLDDKNSFLYLAEENKNKIGQIRFDCKNNRATINYLISNDFRGQGLGQKMVKKAINKITQDCFGIKVIEARVKTTNIASRKIFLKLGFNEHNKTKQIIVYQLQI